VKLGLNTASLGELSFDAMLACNGNQLDPVSGPGHDRVVRDTIALAPRLGVDRVIRMSGCPGGPGECHRAAAPGS